jgi:GxxExxY protein
MVLEHEELTHAIIGAAIDVHKNLGPGFLESIYLNALCIELAQRKLEFERELSLLVRYQSLPVGTHRVDLMVQQQIVVELKAIRALENVHFAVVRSYLRAAGLDHGLLLNFSRVTLEVRRVSAKPDLPRPATAGDC